MNKLPSCNSLRLFVCSGKWVCLWCVFFWLKIHSLCPHYLPAKNGIISILRELSSTIRSPIITLPHLFFSTGTYIYNIADSPCDHRLTKCLINCDTIDGIYLIYSRVLNQPFFHFQIAIGTFRQRMLWPMVCWTAIACCHRCCRSRRCGLCPWRSRTRCNRFGRTAIVASDGRSIDDRYVYTNS